MKDTGGGGDVGPDVRNVTRQLNFPYASMWSTLRIVDQLSEDAATGFGVEKGDAPTVGTDAGYFVDQAHTIGLHSGELAIEIRGTVRDVVHGVATFRQKSGNGAIGIGGCDELDPPSPARERNRFDLLMRQKPMFAPGEAESLVGRQGGI